MQVSALIIAALLFWGTVAGKAESYTFFPIAGNPSGGSSDGTNGTIRLLHPTGIAVGISGQLFVADFDNQTIRELIPTPSGWTSATIAGQAHASGSADGTNSAARLLNPMGIAADCFGNVFIADMGNSTIRKMTRLGTNWVTSTIVGLAGSIGSADGTNNDARFCFPIAIAVDAAGNLFVADNGNFTIRRISPEGANWVTTTIAGSAGQPSPQGCYYNCDGSNGDARFDLMSSIAVDATGTLYVGDSVFNTDWRETLVRKITPAGTNWVVTTFPQGDNQWFGIAAGWDGNLYIASWSNEILQLVPAGSNLVRSTISGNRYPGATDGTNNLALYSSPSAVALDLAGNIYVADTANNTIRKLTRSGTNWCSSTIAGNPPSSGSIDGTDDQARFFRPGAIAVGQAGQIYVADTGSHVIRHVERIGAEWVTRTIAGLPGSPGTSDGTNLNARFNGPCGLACSADERLYIADTGNNTIRKVVLEGPDWVTTTIAGTPGNYYRQDGVNGGAHFDHPNAIACNPDGVVFVAEEWFGAVRQLRAVSTNWVSSTIIDASAPLAPVPAGLAASASGALFVADFTRIDELSPGANGWNFNVIAGLSASPYAIASTGNDALYVADFAVRKLERRGSDWVVTTIGQLPELEAGEWYSWWTSPVGNAEFDGGYAIAVDASRRIYVADTYNNVIRLGLPLPFITSIRRTTIGITLVWTSAPGLTYQLQSSSSAAAGSWSNLGSSTTATTDLTSVTDLMPAVGERYYRIALLP